MANQLPGRCIWAPAKLKTDLGIFLFDSAYYDNTQNSNFVYLVWGGTSGSPSPLKTTQKDDSVRVPEGYSRFKITMEAILREAQRGIRVSRLL